MQMRFLSLCTIYNNARPLLNSNTPSNLDENSKKWKVLNTNPAVVKHLAKSITILAELVHLLENKPLAIEIDMLTTC
jgi:hypothetical protein